MSISDSMFFSGLWDSCFWWSLWDLDHWNDEGLWLRRRFWWKGGTPSKAKGSHSNEWSGQSLSHSVNFCLNFSAHAKYRVEPFPDLNQNSFLWLAGTCLKQLSSKWMEGPGPGRSAMVWTGRPCYSVTLLKTLKHTVAAVLLWFQCVVLCCVTLCVLRRLVRTQSVISSEHRGVLSLPLHPVEPAHAMKKKLQTRVNWRRNHLLLSSGWLCCRERQGFTVESGQTGGNWCATRLLLPCNTDSLLPFTPFSFSPLSF